MILIVWDEYRCYMMNLSFWKFIRNLSKQFLPSCHVFSKGLSKNFLISAIYGSNNDMERRKLWKE